ncbi:MAG: transposase, partial [Pseudomonadota bacterium]
MSQDNVIKLAQPGEFCDAPTEVLRQGARTLLAQAAEAEAAEAEAASFLESHAGKLTEDGHRRLVRHGHLPERKIAAGIGHAGVPQPRVRGRGSRGKERICFPPPIPPPHARRSRSLEVLIPLPRLKGISTGDFGEALAALAGRDAGGLPAPSIARPKEVWAEEHAHWQKRDLPAKQYVYPWAGGIRAQARLEDEAQCIPVIIGAAPDGKKQLAGLTDGIRESALSWKDL